MFQHISWSGSIRTDTTEAVLDGPSAASVGRPQGEKPFKVSSVENTGSMKRLTPHHASAQKHVRFGGFNSVWCQHLKTVQTADYIKSTDTVLSIFGAVRKKKKKKKGQTLIQFMILRVGPANTFGYRFLSTWFHLPIRSEAFFSPLLQSCSEPRRDIKTSSNFLISEEKLDSRTVCG